MDVSHGESWCDLSKRWKLVGYSFLTFLAGPVLSILLTKSLPWYALVSLVPFIAASQYVAAFRCPRCGNRFFVKGLYSNLISGLCLHCQLAVGECRRSG